MQTNYKNKGLLLLKKGQKGIVHALFSRFGLILLLLAVQVLILFGIFQWFEEFLPHVLGGTALFSLFMVIYLLNSSINPTAKITWLIVIMLLPVFGVLLFLYTQSDIGHRALKKRSLEIIDATRKSIPQSAEVMERFPLKIRELLRWLIILPEADVIPSSNIRPLLTFLLGKISLKKC